MNAQVEKCTKYVLLGLTALMLVGLISVAMRSVFGDVGPVVSDAAPNKRSMDNVGAQKKMDNPGAQRRAEAAQKAVPGGSEGRAVPAVPANPSNNRPENVGKTDVRVVDADPVLAELEVTDEVVDTSDIEEEVLENIDRDEEIESIDINL